MTNALQMFRETLIKSSNIHVNVPMARGEVFSLQLNILIFMVHKMLLFNLIAEAVVQQRPDARIRCQGADCMGVWLINILQ